MGIVFAVLALLALTIKGLSLMDREPAPAASPGSAIVSAVPESGMDRPDGGVTGQEVAAIAVALALAENNDESSSASSASVGGSPTTSSPGGSWLQSGRTRLLGSNQPSTPSARSKRGN